MKSVAITRTRDRFSQGTHIPIAPGLLRYDARVEIPLYRDSVYYMYIILHNNIYIYTVCIYIYIYIYLFMLFIILIYFSELSADESADTTGMPAGTESVFG